MADSHTTLDTPHPRERALAVKVEESVFAKNPDILPPTGTLYSDCSKFLFAQDYNKEFADYVYTGQAGDHIILFAKDKTLEEANTPFRAYWTKFGNHRHAPLLHALAFVTDPNFPIATNIISGGQLGVATAPRNYVREIFTAEVNEGSRFWLEELQGPRPFAIGRYTVPQPQPINYQINGVNGSVEPSLHDDIDIPNTRSTTSTFIGGSAGAESGVVPGQFFPRTNMRRRRAYFLVADQKYVNGIWYMQRLRVFPPRLPRVTVQ